MCEQLCLLPIFLTYTDEAILMRNSKLENFFLQCDMIPVVSLVTSFTLNLPEDNYIGGRHFSEDYHMCLYLIVIVRLLGFI